MQAVLILAHKNFNQVIELCDLLRPTFEVYMHIDSKAELKEEQKQKLQELDVHFFSKYDVKWGSYSIVKATIDMMKMALANPEIKYFHLISGQDWPLMNPSKLYQIFENNNKIYMNYWRAVDMRKAGEPEIWWTKYYFNYDQINRRTTFGKIYHRILLFAQTVLRINKLKKFNLDEKRIYAGQEWVDVPRDALAYAINYYDKSADLQNVFRTSFCSDEMWLQTVLCNSKYKNRIDKNIHHYLRMVHKPGHGSRPAVLNENDYSKIAHGEYWWGRKIERPYSNRLIKLIQENDEVE